MLTSIPPIRRAVVVLDQASGELREDDGALLGIDLWPDTASSLSAARSSGLEVVLAAPTEVEEGTVAELSSWVGGIEVVPISPRFRFTDLGDADDVFRRLPAGDSTTALVSADRRLRGEAARAGLQPAVHAALLPILMRGELPLAVRMVAPREVLSRLGLDADLVPLHFQPTADGRWALIALTTAAVRATAVLTGVELHPLPCDPMRQDLVWIRIDGNTPEVRTVLEERTILHAEPGQVLLALGPDEDAEAIHAHGAHGHAEVLLPSTGLTRPAVLPGADGAGLDGPGLPSELLEPVPDAADRWRPDLRLRAPCASITANFENDLKRYTGVTPLDDEGPIVSRHSAHPHNRRVEDQLVCDLRAIGYCAHRHRFTHAGRNLSNVIADLPGTGRYRIRGAVLDTYRETLRARPLSAPLPPDEVAFAGLATPRGNGADRVGVPSWHQLERLLRLGPWFPWWKRICPFPGLGAGIILVGCHLDSTAAFDPGYDPATDPAPGTDDDGSGLAAVLALARYLWALRGRLTHTVRFCFFNAEESGLVGSKAYAAKMKDLNAPIRAAVCMDMIGHDSDANRLFEIHAGYTDPAIRDLSVPLADPVANAAAAGGQLAPAQVYAGTSWLGAPDRAVYDGAINRSDHAAFHQQGYPAILVSEDFFANLAAEPQADPNPDYHRVTDAAIDLHYARNIVCAVARAVIELAR